MRSAETSASEPLVGIRENAFGTPRVRTRALLIAVAGLSLIPRLWVARHHPLSFNGAWHLFIARNFWREYASMAHPPLFVLILKACDAVSHSLLSFRSVLILAGAGCVYLVGRVLQKLGALPGVAVFGALTMACSQAAIILSNLVQGYMLCVFFVLASFFHYLDLVRADRLPGWSSRAAFSTFACLALLVEYMAGLYLLACVAAPLAAVAFSPALRASFRRAFARRWLADCLTLVPPALVGGGLYLVLVRPRWQISSFSYAPFYFHADREKVGEFLARGITGVVNLFAPAVLPSPAWAISLLVVFLVVVLAAPATEREPAKGSSIRLFPALFLAVLLVAGMTLGLLRRYPFGGDGQRHQFLLFLFSVLAGCVALDRLLRAMPRAIRPALTALSFGAIGLNLVLNREAIRKPELEALISKVGLYHRVLDRASAVHVDEFDLVGLFMEYYRWDCRFAGRQPDKPWVERYELALDGRKLDVVAYRNAWTMDFDDPKLYEELRTTFEARGGSCELVFSVNRNIYGRAPWEPWPGATRDPSPDGQLPASERARLEASIPALARKQHLVTRSLELGDYVSAEFCREAAPNSGAARRGLPESLLEAFGPERLSDAEAAVFLLKAKFGDGYAPPPATGAVFSDVRIGDPEAAWIEESSRLGFTEGCGGGRYCPRRSVTRAKAAVLLLKAEHRSGYAPPPCEGVFADVPCPSRYADWIEQLYREGISAGCWPSPRQYCPDDVSSRGQMLSLLAKTFSHDDPRPSANPPAAE